MKILLLLLTFMPFICFGQSYFKCDRKKKVEIMLADHPIRKVSKSKYAAGGNLLIHWHQATIFCDSIICNCKSKTITAWGHLKYDDISKVGYFKCDTITIDLKEDIVSGQHVR